MATLTRFFGNNVDNGETLFQQHETQTDQLENKYAARAVETGAKSIVTCFCFANNFFLKLFFSFKMNQTI